MLSKYRYYTGIIFRAITYGTGEAIASGGRYDSLVAQFGQQMPAIGMSITVDNLLLALERQGIMPESENERCCVLYREDQAEQAIRYAQEQRAAGKPVSLIPVSEGNEEAVFAWLTESGATVCAYDPDNSSNKQ